ncbi:MAG: hypothetical protein AAF789_09165 [Bacteroidota bacterium]
MRLFICASLVVLGLSAKAQDITLPVEKDSLSAQVPIPGDTIVNDSTALSETEIAKGPRKGDIETTIKYEASDSLFIDIDRKELYL